jgi:hypothetical protein
MMQFERVGVPLEPARDGRIMPWSDEQSTVMGACAAAWTAVVRQRRAYDVAVREAGHPETWPHA